MTTAREGDRVRIHYTALLEDGTPFDTTREGEPVEFELGSDALMAPIHSAVLGMGSGDEKTIELAPEDAYGARSEGLEQHVARDTVPWDAKKGDTVRGRVGDDEIVFWIASVGDNSVVLDPNHPLAGHTLTFRIEVVDVVASKDAPDASSA